MNKVLIVEDEKLIRQGIKTMVMRSGIPVNEIVECNNGESALEILKENKIDVMFTDIRMPKMDGITLVRNIREMELEHVPHIAVISGYDDFDYAVQMLRNGVKEYLLKPVDRKRISEVLTKFEEEIILAEEKFEKNRQKIYQQMLYMMLYDGVKSNEIEEIADGLKKYVPYDEFVVVVGNFTENGIESQEYAIYFNGLDYMNFYIVDLKHKYDLLDQLTNFNVGISKRYHNLRDLRQAYYEAIAMRKTSFSMDMHIVDNEFFKRVEQEEYGVKTMMQTANLICSEKIEEALDVLGKFVDRVKERGYSVEDFEEQIKIILTTTINMYKNSLKTEEEDIMELLSMYRYQTIDAYMEVVRTWISRFNDLIDDEEDDSKNYIKIQNAIEYIKENFASDLNMAVVSNHVSMNYSLFSYTFKKYTGTNFVNYLKEVRIGEAKKLLQDSHMKIVEISALVGYEHEKHFTRTFKNITGLTPSQYRNSFL